jgi:hypothetical protein
MVSAPNHSNVMKNADWSFVAMEYYALILNRTYIITIKDGALCGVVCRGLTSIESGNDPLAKIATRKLAVHGDLNDPKSYVNVERIRQPNSANFSIPLSDISLVEHDARKKWGMGYYPHDGRIFVRAVGKKREFIILGNQSGKEIAERLRMCVSGE